jgi:hypothetical protein
MDDRGLSTAVTSVLTLAILTVLVVGLIISTTGFVEGQRERAARSELTIIGERTANELVGVDRIANGSGTVRLETDHTDMVVGEPYTVTLTDDDGRCGVSMPCLVMQSDALPEGVVVPVRVDAPVRESTAPGGEVSIVYDGSELALGRGGAT